MLNAFNRNFVISVFLISKLLLIFTYHFSLKVEPKAQMILLANPTSSSSGGSCPSEIPGSETCDSSIGRKNIHPSENHEASDILMTPKLLANDDNSGTKPEGIQVDGTAAAALSAIHQAVILAKCLLIEKSTRHDDMQSNFPLYIHICTLMRICTLKSVCLRLRIAELTTSPVFMS